MVSNSVAYDCRIIVDRWYSSGGRMTVADLPIKMDVDRGLSLEGMTI